jgi:hypothetical protein
MIKCLKKIDNYFFYENINHYINTMTGHTPNAEQSQEFLSTMHTMIDDLDTISAAIDENTYIRLVNGLQRLYNIHNSSIQSPNSVRETLNQRNQNRLRENFLDNNEVEITRILAQHYGRVYDSSGVLINNEPYPINSDANRNTNASTNPIINSALNNYNNYINYDSWNENNPAQNRDSARISYTSVTSNHWIETALREGLRSAR